MTGNEEFDRMTCQEQVRLVLDKLTDAAEEDDMDKVRAALMPLALIANRVKALEGNE